MSKLVIIGGGESGYGAALLGRREGWEVFVTDGGPIASQYEALMEQKGIPFEAKGHSFEKFSDTTLVVKSPGVPESAPIVKYFREAGVPIISEIEFGYRYCDSIILAITGSNGKTTTSGLLYHLLHTAGYDVALGGNYGKSFCSLLCEERRAYYVLEISSFQLDDCTSFSPEVAAILNITPDHLDRYNYDFGLYAAAKFKISAFQHSGQTIVLNMDDEGILEYKHLLTSESKQVSITKSQFIDGLRSKEGSVFEMTLRGHHNLLNAAVAVAMAREVGVTDGAIAQGLGSFVNLPHRMELVATIEGVSYINDSKATNVDATYYALEAIPDNVIWVAGGTDKGNDYSPLDALVKDRVKALICLGLDNDKLVQHFQDKVAVIKETQSIEELIKIVSSIAKEGDTVLLSPACASFDLFRNYIDRGDQFKTEVLKKIVA